MVYPFNFFQFILDFLALPTRVSLCNSEVYLSASRGLGLKAIVTFDSSSTLRRPGGERLLTLGARTGVYELSDVGSGFSTVVLMVEQRYVLLTN